MILLYLIEIGQFKAALTLVSLNKDIPIIATDGAIVKGVMQLSMSPIIPKYPVRKMMCDFAEIQIYFSNNFAQFHGNFAIIFFLFISIITYDNLTNGGHNDCTLNFKHPSLPLMFFFTLIEIISPTIDFIKISRTFIFWQCQYCKCWD